jgi:tRNA 2-thiouridine synthesizing protein E
MTQYKINAQDSETSSQYANIRQAELGVQNWNRARSETLATNDGLELTDQHWQVISYLREQYLEHGLPLFARTTVGALNKKFAEQGGSKYLHNLFPGGPVTQGNRLANLRTPANATDISFGTSY